MRRATEIAGRWPQITLLLRKVANGLPAVGGGVLARKTAASGAIVHTLGLAVPTLLPMCLLMIASSVTEYLVLDCVFLMMAGDVLESSSDVGPSRANAVLFVSIVGVLIAHEKWVEERVLGIPPAAE
jgi:hypothetical protein